MNGDDERQAEHEVWEFLNPVRGDFAHLPPPPSQFAALPPPPHSPTMSDWLIQIILLMFCGIIGIIVLITNRRFSRSQKWSLFFCVIGGQFALAFFAGILNAGSPQP